jgi:MFS family permease
MMIGRREWLGLSAVLVATFMTQVDGFVVNVASPSIQRDLDAGFDQIQFVGASYVLAFAALLITGARLGDLAGHRRVFLYGVTGFTLTSLLCGLAPNAEWLIAGRFAQGAAAAFMAPQVLSIIRATVSDDKQRAKAIGVYGVTIGLGVVCGIAGGGILVDLDLFGLGWRPAFLINIPFGVVILALGRVLPRGGAATSTRLDLAGAALTMVALPALLAPLVFGPGSSAYWVWLGVPVALAVFAVLVRQQRQLAASGGNPLFPPQVVAEPAMKLGLLAVTALFLTNAGLFLTYTYYLQTGLGIAPTAAGLMFVPLGIGFALGSSAARRLVTRVRTPVAVVGARLLAVFLLVAAAISQLPAGAQPPLLTIMIGFAGLSQGLVVATLVAGILARIAPENAGGASGLALTTAQVGLALGVAVAGAFYKTVLGATPGDPGIAFADSSTAFGATAVLLALVAVGTSLIVLRMNRPAAQTPHELGKEPVTTQGRT